MRKVIFDCDNTFGMIDRDVDDGLTLFYLLGSPMIDLLGVTLTYGNGSLEEVSKMTKEIKQRLDLSFGHYSTAQAEFLVEQVNRHPNKVTILATGALTNLAEAQKIDSDFFRKVQEIVLMGGTLEPLLVNQRPVAELNFSCDAEAAKAVLLSQVKLTIMNGHMTSEALFSRIELDKFLELAAYTISQEALIWISNTLEEWIDWNKKIFNFNGFCNWDMTTAVYLERPELFSNEHYYLSVEQLKLSQGRMTITDDSPYKVKMPKKLLAVTEFNKLVIDRMILGLKRTEGY